MLFCVISEFIGGASKSCFEDIQGGAFLLYI